MRISEIPTPALILDKNVMQGNIEKMDKILAGSPMTLYPHYKSNKCPSIAKMQVEHGAGGITCAKLSEAEDLAAAGIPEIIIANQIVQAGKVERAAVLAGKCSLTVCVDCKEQAVLLDEAAGKQGTIIKILVEYDVGMHRCGVESFEEFLELAGFVDRCENLIFEGIQAYAGNLAHEWRGDVRREKLSEVEARVKELKAFVEENGLSVKHVCGGSTGTAADKPGDTIYTQLQAGSYLFMDTSYGRLDLSFEQSLFVLTTVISVRPDHIVLDTGVKSLSMDQEPPVFPDHPDADITFSEEHMSLQMDPGELKIGDRLYCIPGHCCTTVNTFDEIYLVDGEEVTAVWPVVSRGKAQ